jgi:hypothetical protein
MSVRGVVVGSTDRGLKVIFYTPSFALKIMCCVDQLNPPEHSERD